jgi:hypothetical protein
MAMTVHDQVAVAVVSCPVPPADDLAAEKVADWLVPRSVVAPRLVPPTEDLPYVNIASWMVPRSLAPCLVPPPEDLQSAVAVADWLVSRSVVAPTLVPSAWPGILLSTP